MRWNLLVAFSLIALAFIATVVVACSDTTSCAAGTLQLRITLLDTAPLADTIKVVDSEPAHPTMVTVAHTPNPTAGGLERTTVEVSWPGGYPGDKVVNLLVQALGGVTILGASTATIHLDPKCTVGNVGIRSGLATPSDLGMTD
jgi:hypothetical protein